MSHSQAEKNILYFFLPIRQCGFSSSHGYCLPALLYWQFFAVGVVIGGGDMQLTTKGRFAVTAMVDLAMYGGDRPINMAAISMRQKISLSYLEQLFCRLRRRQILKSVRGTCGGYYLAKPADKISIAEIIVAVGEPLDATGCGGKGNCSDGRPCLTHKLWLGLNEAIYDYLSFITLQQLVDSQAKMVPGNGHIKVSNVKRKA